MVGEAVTPKTDFKTLDRYHGMTCLFPRVRLERIRMSAMRANKQGASRN